MCYNFATFVLYLDVITLIYRENRLTSSETCLSAEIKTSPVKSTFYGTFSIYPVDNRKTHKPVFTEPEMPKS